MVVVIYKFQPAKIISRADLACIGMIGFMPDRRPPKDPNQLAKYILDVTTGEEDLVNLTLRRAKKNSPKEYFYFFNAFLAVFFAAFFFVVFFAVFLEADLAAA